LCYDQGSLHHAQHWTVDGKDVEQ